MTTTETKILTATSLVLAIAVGFETHQFCQQREKSFSLTQKTETFDVKLQQIRREHDRTLSAIETTQNAIKTTQSLAKYATTDSELGAWLDRVNHLKQWLQAAPERRIPEMEFLTSNDWLSVTLNNRLNTDASIREAMSELRAIAKRKPQVVDNMEAALRDYRKTNDQPPSNPMLLQPYLKPQLSDEILQRYEAVPEVPGSNDANVAIVEGMRMVGSSRIVLREKAPVDEDYDTWIVYTEKGGMVTGSTSEIGKTVDQAARAFNKANNGQDASTPEQLLPFISTPVDPIRLKEYWEISRHR